jgi:hypothetical protein
MTIMGVETVLALAGGIGGAVMSAAGGVASANGAIQKGQATQQAATYNAQVDQQRAAEEQDQAAASTQDYIRKGSDTVEGAVASQGASGVTGESPLMVDENTVRQVALGAARTLQGGDLRASRLRDDATLQRMRGDAAVRGADLDATGSYLNAGGSLLTSVGKFGPPGSTFKPVNRVGGTGLSLTNTGGLY